MKRSQIKRRPLADTALQRRAQRRMAGAFALSGLITTAAFWLLLTGRIEGGPFVSMLTLALATATLILLWERIAKIDFMGHKIELRDLARRAEKSIDELSESRTATLKTALALTGKRSGGAADGESADDADTLALLDHIDRSGLTPALAEEVLEAAERVIENRRARAAPGMRGTLAPRSGRSTDPPRGPAVGEEAVESGPLKGEAPEEEAIGLLARAFYHRDSARACLFPATARGKPDR